MRTTVERRIAMMHEMMTVTCRLECQLLYVFRTLPATDER